MTDKEKIRAEVKRRRESHRKAKRIESAFEDNAILFYIDSMQEEPKFKTDDRIKPIDSCLGSPRTIVEVCDSWYVTFRGTLDFEYEDNWELVEEHKKCMYSKDSYTNEDRKVLCKGCEEECRFNKKEDSVNNGLDLGCGVIWRDKEPVSDDLEEVAHRYYEPNDTFMDGFKKCVKWKEQQLEKNCFTACDRQTEKEAEIECDFVTSIIEKEHRQPTFDDAIKYGMRLKEEEIKKVLLSEVLPCFMHGGESDEVVAKLDEVLNQKK